MDAQRTKLDPLLGQDARLGFVLGFDLVVPVGGIERGGGGGSGEVVDGQGSGRSWPGSSRRRRLRKGLGGGAWVGEEVRVGLGMARGDLVAWFATLFGDKNFVSRLFDSNFGLGAPRIVRPGHRSVASPLKLHLVHSNCSNPTVHVCFPVPAPAQHCVLMDFFFFFLRSFVCVDG
jgi:hypothetical protein